MCGITGYTGSLKDRNVIKAMTTALAHRGPDAEDFFSDGGITFGFRRLAIIDLSTGGQPMSFGAYTIVFNGEIYNYRELREELSLRGDTFKTTSDTEVLLHAFAAYGPQCLNKLDGMFAFAVWNAQAKELFIARDQLGIKPLYYTHSGDSFVFGSEIKALLKHPSVRREPNYGALESYFRYRYVVGEETFFSGIKSLSPGHYLTVKEGSEPQSVEYWSLSTKEKKDEGEAYYVREVRARLEKTVERMMHADVPVGSYLSGGLDSSIVVGLMASLKKTELHTFTVGFKGDEQNEFAEARAVSEMWGTTHHELALEPREYFDGLETLIGYKDAPLSVPNELPLWRMSQALRNYVTVVLSGEGADELFGGYGRIFRAAHIYDRDHLEEPFGEYLLRLYSYTPDEWLSRILPKDMRGRESSATRHIADIFSRIQHMPHEEQALYFFQRVHLSGLLHRLDTPTMAASVEGRVPYVDKELIEFVHSIPFSHKVRWQEGGEKAALGLSAAEISEKLDTPKYLLRKACADLVPKDVLTRKKVGFPVPLEAWLRGPFREHARRILTDTRTCDRNIFPTELLRADDFYKSAAPLTIWMMVNVELFMRQYFD